MDRIDTDVRGYREQNDRRQDASRDIVDEHAHDQEHDGDHEQEDVIVLGDGQQTGGNRPRNFSMDRSLPNASRKIRMAMTLAQIAPPSMKALLMQAKVSVR